jgi:peptidoglycan/LPS O-acetylase OafA/YrhL
MVIEAETQYPQQMNDQASSGDRLYCMDHLRAFIIGLVVIEHAAIPYMMTDNKNFWFFWDENTSLSFTGFVILANVIIRPVLFFISGFFFVPSVTKKGSGSLMQSKLIRLGIPLAFAMLLINPFAFYIANLVKGNEVGNFLHYLFTNWLIGKDTAAAHLWFLESLLTVTGIYCLLYAVRPSVFKEFITDLSGRIDPLGQIGLFASVLTLSLFITTAAIGGNVYTMWSWIGNGVIYIEPTRFINYIFYFGLGIIFHHNFSQFSLSFPFGKKIWFWLVLAILSGSALILFAFKFKLVLLNSYELIFAGSLLRVLTSLSTLILLLLLFEKYLSDSSAFSRWLSRNSYAVYLIHLPVLVGLQAVFLSFSWNAFAKFPIVAFVSIVVSYLLGTYVLRQFPVMNRIL